MLEGIPIKKNAVYSRFNVGAMMKARKDCRQKAAQAHDSILKAKKDLEAMHAKQRRLEAKVKIISCASGQ